MVTETVARTALNASSRAYDDDNLGIDGYTAPSVVRGHDGFSALVYRQSDDPSKALVAFAGTGSLVDAFADINLGTNQWQNNRAAVFAELGSGTTEVVFTGHSLGGGLAQYAAYEFSDPNGANSGAHVSVITYNALGGESGAKLMHGESFDDSRLADVNGVHFAETKDVVARLGNGHLGGEVIRHDLNSSNVMSAHQLKESFLKDEHLARPLLGGQRNDPSFSYLQVDNGQQIAAALANTANKPPFDLVTPGEATVGLLRGMGGILLLAPDEEINALGNAILPEHPVSDWSHVRNMLGPVGITGDYLAENGPAARDTAQAILRQHLADALSGAASGAQEIQRFIEGVETTGERIGELFDHTQTLFGDGARAAQEAAQKLYLESVGSGAQAKQVLLSSYERIDNLNEAQRQTLQNLYDSGSDWVARQLTEMPARLERANDVVISDIGDVLQDWINDYEEAKQDGLRNAGDFLNDGLNRLRRSAGGAADLVENVALALPQYMQFLKQDFLSTLGLIPTISPLVVDLDGDGIELTPLTSTSRRFDLDADDFAEQTGWVSADDGLLVFDRNGNGHIDNGKELFGEHTSIADGSTAINGFAALRALDSNGDSTITSADTTFNELRIWRDLNSDARSQSHELFKLEDLAIQSIETDAETSTQTVAGHTLALRAQYQTTDASSMEIADVLFQVDQTNTRRSGLRNVSIASLGEANLRGYGVVDDLQIAMSRDPILQELTRLITNTPLASATSLLSQTERLIYRWTGTDHIDPSSRGAFDARKLTAIERMSAVEFRSRGGENDPSGMHYSNLSQTWTRLTQATLVRLLAQHQNSPLTFSFDFTADSVSSHYSLDELISTAKFEQPEDLEAALNYWQKIALGLGAMTDHFQVTENQLQDMIVAQLAGSSVGAFSEQLFEPHLSGTTGNDELHPHESGVMITSGPGNDDIRGARGEQNLLVGGPGDDYLRAHAYQKSADRIVGGPGDDTLVGSRFSDDYYFARGDGHDRLDESAGGFVSKHSLDRLWFGEDIEADDLEVSRAGTDLVLRIKGGADSLTVAGWYQNAGVDGRDRRLESVHFANGEIWDTTTLHEMGLLVRGSDDDDDLTSLSYHDNTLLGAGGNDTLRAGSGGNDQLFGGDGSDRLLGGANGVDHLFGEAGNDRLESYRNLAAATQFYGGPGDDRLVGSRYADDYFFSSGDGHDVVDESAGGRIATRYPDRLFFSPEVSIDQVSIARQDKDLTLSVGADGDAVTVLDWYNQAGIEGRDKRLESVHFGSGELWDVDQLHRAGLTLHGSSGDDLLSGLHHENNILFGHDGNDTIHGANFSKDKLYGNGGDDYLLSGTNSKDKLFGGDGNDRLESYINLGAAVQFYGEAGDDLLIGSRYADDYHFGVGDGHDVIDETHGGLRSETHPDRLWFTDDIAAEDVRVHRDGEDIVIALESGGDQITILNWYHRAGQNGYDKRLEAVHFADGTHWSTSDLEQMALDPTAFFDDPNTVLDALLTAQTHLMVNAQTSSTSQTDISQLGVQSEEPHQTLSLVST